MYEDQNKKSGSPFLPGRVQAALVSSFDHSNQNAALLKMAAHLKLIEDAELKELTRRTVRKLNKLTDAEFASIDFTVYDSDAENEEADHE